MHLPAGSVLVNKKLVLLHERLQSPLRFDPGAQPLRVAGGVYRGSAS